MSAQNATLAKSRCLQELKLKKMNIKMASTLFSGLLQSLEESMESHIIEYRTETNDHPSTPQSVIPERLLTPNPENSSIHFLEMFKNPK